MVAVCVSVCVYMCVFVHQAVLVDSPVNSKPGMAWVCNLWISLKMQCSKDMVFSFFASAIHLAIVSNSIS